MGVSEVWDVLDENGEPTGRTTLRGKAPLKPGEYHLAVHIWIVNEKKQVLIQQRSHCVEFMAGQWAVTGGSVIHGEDSRHGAARELAEELGIVAPPEALAFLFRVKRMNSFSDVWFLHADISLCDVHMQDEEVQAVKWVSVPQLQKMVEDGSFHSYPYMNELYPILEA